MNLPGKWIESRFAGSFLILGGLALVATGAWFSAQNVVFLGATERVEGTVIGIREKRGARGSTLYHPVVRYHHPGTARDIEFVGGPGLWPSPFAAGDRVTVAYARNDPGDARVVSFWTLWFLPGVTAAFGLGCVVAGRSNLRKHR